MNTMERRLRRAPVVMRALAFVLACVLAVVFAIVGWPVALVRQSRARRRLRGAHARYILLERV